jgi:hypothetical protein
MSENKVVDVEGLVGGLFLDAAKALAGTVTLTVSGCEDDGHPLSERQLDEMIESTLLAGANLEAKFARQVLRELDRLDIQARELGELERILGENA